MGHQWSHLIVVTKVSSPGEIVEGKSRPRGLVLGEAGHESLRLFEQLFTPSPIQEATHGQRQLLSIEGACTSSSIRPLLLKPPLVASRHSNALKPEEAWSSDHRIWATSELNFTTAGHWNLRKKFSFHPDTIFHAL